MCRTIVPKTTVNEYHNLFFAENEIGFPNQFFIPPPSTNPIFTKY